MSLLESAIVAGLVALTSSLLASQQVAELVVEAFSRQASGSFFAVKVVASIISYALLHLIFGSVVLEGMRAKTWLGAPGEEEREKPRPLHSAIGVIVACLPSVLIATASWPSVRAVYGDVLAQERGAPYLLLGGFWLAPVAAICILVLLHRFPSAAKRFNRVAPLAAAFIYICISLLIFAFHVPVWQQVGGTALVLLFLTILVLGVHKLASWRGVLPVVLVFGLALWWTLPTVLRGPTETARWPEEALGFTTKPDNLFRLDEAASAWLDSRLGRWPQRERQPIFIVAAQGGGMYAAYHTAFALARLNDTSCGRFNEHTFAISAVSGGAFGAGVYGALVNSQLAVREGQDACQWQMTDLVRAYFASDFLTPMIVSGLYVDLPLTLAGEGRWLFGRSARALAFEKAISGRFSDLGQHAAAKLFEAPFQAFWKPEAGGPALVFTSTLVNNATPILISPFEDLDPFPARRSISSSKVVGPNPTYWGWVWRDIKLDTLSQMISLTSRFPFVSPPETINWLGSRVHYKLADGGFVDNSGAFAAKSMVASLKRVLKQRGVESNYRIIAVVIGDEPNTTIDVRGHNPDEISAVFVSMYRARELADAMALRALKDEGVEVERNNLFGYRAKFALSWQLSERTRNEVERTADVFGRKDRTPRGISGSELENHDSNCRILRAVGVPCATSEELLTELGKRLTKP